MRWLAGLFTKAAEVRELRDNNVRLLARLHREAEELGRWRNCAFELEADRDRLFRENQDLLEFLAVVAPFSHPSAGGPR